MQKLNLIFILSLLIFSSCHNEKKSATSKPEQAKKIPMSASGIEVKAKLLKFTSETDKNPVEATIQIISVIKRGNNFSNQISGGIKIKAKFENYNTKAKRLNEGEEFVAVMESRLQLNSNQPLYLITYYYKKIK